MITLITGAKIENNLIASKQKRNNLLNFKLLVFSLEIEYRFDVGSLFSYYDFVNIAGVAREIGLNPSVMRQYAIGVRKPSEERKLQIVAGLKNLADKMQHAVLY